MSKDKPARETVAEHISYDPATGIFRWKQSPDQQRTRSGKIAGWIAENKRNGYRFRRITLLDREYQASHLAWLLMTGEWPYEIDHHNNDATDDRWENLRLATQTQNTWNKRVSSKSRSGYKGVVLHKHGKWVAQIGRRHIGYFTTAEDAARAYDEEAIKTYGEFAYLNFPNG